MREPLGRQSSLAGNCYEAACRVLHERPDHILVHGWPTLTVPPFEPFDHAWVETPDGLFVIDASNHKLRVVPGGLYYRKGKIDSVKCYRYMSMEMLHWTLWSGHWGPWEGPAACPPCRGHGEGPSPAEQRT